MNIETLNEPQKLIYEAITIIESEFPANIHLTTAQVLLQEALNKIETYRDEADSHTLKATGG